MNTLLSAYYFYTRVIWHWNERCGLYAKFELKAPLTMCASQHLSPRWIARPATEVVSVKPFCQVKHSKKPVTRKPQGSLALQGTLHPTRAPQFGLGGWLVWLGEMGEKAKAVFVYERRRFVKIKVKVFHCFVWGKCASDYTLHSCGGTLHESKCFWVWGSTYTLT